jgi:autotransporter adhesin
MKPLTPRAKVAALALLVAYGTSYGQALGGSAIGDESLALGESSKASGTYSTALGAGSEASGEASIALGVASTSSGSSSTAVGAGSEASGRSSVALGVASEATEDDTVSVGSGNEDDDTFPATRRIVNVTAGKNATDAVNKAQLDALMASLGKLLARIEALEAKARK